MHRSLPCLRMVRSAMRPRHASGLGMRNRRGPGHAAVAGGVRSATCGTEGMFGLCRVRDHRKGGQ